MNQAIAIRAHCGGCGLESRPGSRFCSRCGIPITTAESALSIQPRQTVVASRSVRALLDNRLAVIGVLICAGPLGLPLLWFSRRFSRRTKIITTVLYFGLTVVVPLVMAYYWMEIAVRPLLEVFEPSTP